MEGARFDYLARAVATSGWRRQVLSAHCGAVGNESLTADSIIDSGPGLRRGAACVVSMRETPGRAGPPALTVSRPGAGQGN